MYVPLPCFFPALNPPLNTSPLASAQRRQPHRVSLCRELLFPVLPPGGEKARARARFTCVGPDAAAGVRCPVTVVRGAVRVLHQAVAVLEVLGVAAIVEGSRLEAVNTLPVPLARFVSAVVRVPVRVGGGARASKFGRHAPPPCSRWVGAQERSRPPTMGAGRISLTEWNATYRT